MKTTKTMKTKNIFYGFIIGLIFLTSCSKSDDITNQEPNSNVVTDIEGNSYNTVEIGTQIWTKENLNVSRYRNGDPILQVANINEWNSLTTGAWCYYKNEESNGVIYGKLYNWYAINDPRGIAPEGWHIPSTNEWILLKDFLITNGFNYDQTTTGNKIAKSLASKNLWAQNKGLEGFSGNNPVLGDIGFGLLSNNTTNFTALPAGERDGTGSNANWWSSTSVSSTNAVGYRLEFNSSSLILLNNKSKRAGFSIRLVKN